MLLSSSRCRPWADTVLALWQTAAVMTRRAAALLVAVGMTISLAACSGDDQGPSPVDTPAAVGSSSSPASSVSTTRPSSTNRQPPELHFKPSMVRAHGVSKQNKGGQSDVRFVAGSKDPAVIKRLAIECVEHFTQETEAAFCYAYGTQVDYDTKTPDWTPEFDKSAFGGSRPCWVAQAGQALNWDEPEIPVETDRLQYEVVNKCKGGVKFE